jgi:hypothetical protein
MKAKHYIPLSIAIALFYLVFEILIHWLVYGEGTFRAIPLDIHELLLRIIIFIMIICFGVFAAYQMKKIIAEQDEKRQVYKTTTRESKRILKEFLNEVRYFEGEAEKEGGFNDIALKYLEEALSNTEARLDKLGNVGDITAENIILSVHGPMKIEIPEVIRMCATECTKELKCLEVNKQKLCPVEKCIEGKIHFIKCLDDNDCYYRNKLDSLYSTCTCPVRKEIFNKYGI